MTTSAAVPRTGFEIPRALRRFAWGVLAYNVAVIVWGAAVRATGSGAGCGDHWPLCNGTLVQHHPAVATLIELAHRATSGVDLVCVLVLVGWTFFAAPRKHLARAGAVAVLVLTLNEAFLGALLVLLGHTARDMSPARAVYLGLHLTNTLLLLAALALTAHFLSRQAAMLRGAVRLRAPGLALTGLAATLVVGVTGSLAALGDTLYPAHNLMTAIAQDFSPGSSWLLRIRWVHPAISFVAGAFICWLVVNALRNSEAAEARTLAIAVALLLGVQYVLGVADVGLLAPTWVQMLHLLGADLLWIALVLLSVRLCLVPKQATTV
ncbi:MAG TPA: COX15/CtaA family protein [Acidobacteriaceae bacterium]|nr:COX15/CtaA family protein [Acidobacteriaceae bacterium]